MLFSSSVIGFYKEKFNEVTKARKLSLKAAAAGQMGLAEAKRD